MADKSNIEWTDATWPVVTGCTHISPGCLNCYAAREAAGRLKHTKRYKGLAVRDAFGTPRWTGEVRCHEDLLDQPARWKKPRRIFVAPSGDLFHNDVGADFLWKVQKAMCDALHHTFIVLTKRPANIGRFFWPKDRNGGEFASLNVILGTSAENQEMLGERWDRLKGFPASRYLVSLEPLLGPVRLSASLLTLGRSAWVIVGGESGKDARPMHPDWVRTVRDQCVSAGVPFFFKQWGEWIHGGVGSGYREALIAGDGEVHDPATIAPGTRQGMAFMVRAGKKKAGRTLDRKVWDQYPE